MESRIDAYTHAVANYLAKHRPFLDMMTSKEYAEQFTLEGHKFSVSEYELANVMTLETTRVISVWSCDCPDLGSLSVAYNSDFWGRKDDTESRVEACMKLADNFVRNMLPKVDYKFKAQVHNDEIENILEALP